MSTFAWTVVAVGRIKITVGCEHGFLQQSSLSLIRRTLPLAHAATLSLSYTSWSIQSVCLERPQNWQCLPSRPHAASHRNAESRRTNVGHWRFKSAVLLRAAVTHVDSFFRAGPAEIVAVPQADISEIRGWGKSELAINAAHPVASPPCLVDPLLGRHRVRLAAIALQQHLPQQCLLLLQRCQSRVPIRGADQGCQSKVSFKGPGQISSSTPVQMQVA